MWARHDVHERTNGAKRFNNPLVGEIALNYQALSVTGAVGQSLYIFSAEPGTASAQSLILLAGIARGEAGTPDVRHAGARVHSPG